ncbi:Cell division cycle 5-like protein [Raphanus sativus]|nr:Cell division cycle 5-like protein [Raphanus sativus]
MSERAWSSSEDAKLKSGVAKYGEMKWASVSASVMNHRRSAKACKERFSELKEPKWTEEDDDHLKRLVKSFGLNVLWTTVATTMSRPCTSCQNRYKYLMDENRVIIPARPTANSSSERRRGMKRKIEL